MEDTMPEHAQPQKQAEEDGGGSGEEKLKPEANNDSVYPEVADDGKVCDYGRYTPTNACFKVCFVYFDVLYQTDDFT